MTVQHINREGFGDENQPYFYPDDGGCVGNGVDKNELADKFTDTMVTFKE